MCALSLRSNIISQAVQTQLTRATALVSKSVQALSSGLRINSPADDPAGLAVAAGLERDARVYTKGVQNVNDAISYYSVAQGATDALTNILTRISELAAQASNGNYLATQRQALDEESRGLVNEYNRIVQTTQFNGISIFSSSNTKLNVQAGSGQQNTIALDLSGQNVGNGTFGAKQSTATGTQPYSVATGDLNGDGFADLVTADQGSNVVSVYLGNGNGTFQARQTYATGSGPANLSIADLNGDGKPDLVTTNYAANTVSVLLGNGDGTFQAKQDAATGLLPHGLASADFNGDGKQDIVTADYNSNTVSVLLGNGNGTFQARQTYATGTNPNSVAVGDFNGDGKQDFVTTDSGSTTLSVFLGNGDGTFQARRTFTAASLEQFVTVGDLNGDGKQDLVTADGTGTVSVLLGNGDGTFAAKQSYATGLGPSAAAIADLNGDGTPDLVASDYPSNSVCVLLGNGDGTFGIPQAFTTGTHPQSIAVGDFNHDGAPDVATADFTGNTVSVLLANTHRASLTTIGGIDLTTAQSALASQSVINNYLTTVSTVSGAIGASTSRLQVAVNDLQDLAENATVAKSRITDVDVAEETANYTKASILQQADVSLLAHANLQPELALQLLESSLGGNSSSQLGG